jgi:hypothetical protein
MLEKLAGRLKWEKTGPSIRVEIPAGRDWVTLIGGFGLAIFALFSLCVALLSLTIDIPTTTKWMCALGLVALECLALSVLIWNFKGKTLVELNPAQMKIVRHALGVEWNKRSFATRDLRNLEYLPSSGFRISRYYIPGVIRFEANDKTCNFASGISDIEAFALIDRMLDVYEVPKDRALEYIGIRR